MDVKKKQTLYWILFAVYLLLVFSPFIIPGLNAINPVILGMPLTMWYIHVVILLGRILVFFGSKKLWQSFDDTDDKGEVKK